MIFFSRRSNKHIVKVLQVLCVVLLAGTLLFGCTGTDWLRYTASTQAERTFYRTFSQLGEDVAEQIQLRCGKTLVMCSAKNDDGTTFLDTFIYQYDPSSNEAQTEWLSPLQRGTVQIFYDEGWTYAKKHYNSFFQRVVNGTARDIVILVMPNRDPDKTYDTEQIAQLYNNPPHDSLDTVPFLVHNKSWEQDFPVWIFDVPAEKIDDGYELVFGSWKLTGSDILQVRWRIGDAPILGNGNP